MNGKIIRGVGGFYYVHDRQETVYACRAKGIFRRLGLKPAVGDDVEISVTDEKDLEGNILSILPRKNLLIRPFCANVDQALAVFSVKEPELNKGLLDRYLVSLQAFGIPAGICFSKTDLAGAGLQDELRQTYAGAGCPLLFVSAAAGTGLLQVKNFLDGKTTVLAGPSGVGKSSLTNLLYPEADMETGEVSGKIRRGRHTTRHAELFCVAENTFLMDTPGFSALELPQMEAQELKSCFPEITALEGNCRFGVSCMHLSEPDCPVREALAGGRISRSRYENYAAFYQELRERRRY